MSTAKLEISLKDLFIECDGGSEDCISVSISDALKNEVTHAVKTKLLAGIKDEIKQEMQRQIVEKIRDEVGTFIKATIMNELTELKIYSGYNRSGTSTPAKEFIITSLEDELKKGDFGKAVRKIATDYADTIKERFDVVFASTLLDKMMKSGLLKDDRIASLLDK